MIPLYLIFRDHSCGEGLRITNNARNIEISMLESKARKNKNSRLSDDNVFEKLTTENICCQRPVRADPLNKADGTLMNGPDAPARAIPFEGFTVIEDSVNANGTEVRPNVHMIFKLSTVSMATLSCTLSPSYDLDAAGVEDKHIIT